MLEITKDQKDWTPEQRKMLPAVVHGGRLDEATSLQLLHFCQKTGLDIFTKQAYAIARGGRVTLQAGVDGLAAVAQRAAAARGLIIGNRPTRYFNANGQEFPFAPKDLHALTYTMTTTDARSGAVSEYSVTVLMAEYKQGGQMWSKLPAVMLEKVAISKAYRMAFPTDLSGVYSTEEVDLRDTQNDYTSAANRKPEPPIGKASTAADESDPFAVEGPDAGRTVATAKRELLDAARAVTESEEAAIALAKAAWSSNTPKYQTVSDAELAALMENLDNLANSSDDEEEVN